MNKYPPKEPIKWYQIESDFITIIRPYKNETIPQII